MCPRSVPEFERAAYVEHREHVEPWAPAPTFFWSGITPFESIALWKKSRPTNLTMCYWELKYLVRIKSSTHWALVAPCTLRRPALHRRTFSSPRSSTATSELLQWVFLCRGLLLFRLSYTVVPHHA